MSAFSLILSMVLGLWRSKRPKKYIWQKLNSDVSLSTTSCVPSSSIISNRRQTSLQVISLKLCNSHQTIEMDKRHQRQEEHLVFFIWGWTVPLNICTCLHIINLELDQIMRYIWAFETRYCGFLPAVLHRGIPLSPSDVLMASLTLLDVMSVQPNTESAHRESAQSIWCPDLTHVAALSATAWWI